MTDTTHDDLVKRLTVKAGVMEMGEMIAWGSDTALMREAADRIEELEDNLAKARVEGFWAGRSCGGSKKAIDTALAKLLKGQDDE